MGISCNSPMLISDEMRHKGVCKKFHYFTHFESKIVAKQVGFLYGGRNNDLRAGQKVAIPLQT